MRINNAAGIKAFLYIGKYISNVVRNPFTYQSRYQTAVENKIKYIGVEKKHDKLLKKSQQFGRL